MSKTIQGKKLCINGFADFHDSSKWMAMAVEAFGFPKESAKYKGNETCATASRFLIATPISARR